MESSSGDSGPMSFRSRSGQCLIRAVSTVLAVTLVLILTPCCEVLAALPTAGAPTNADASHTHHDDGDAPPTGEHCAPWLSQTFIPVGDAALPSPGPSGIDAPPPYQPPSVPFPRMASVVPHAGAPPPARALYLLTSRFLL
jgi:hypothetical protein